MDFRYWRDLTGCSRSVSRRRACKADKSPDQRLGGYRPNEVIDKREWSSKSGLCAERLEGRHLGRAS